MIHSHHDPGIDATYCFGPISNICLNFCFHSAVSSASSVLMSPLSDFISLSVFVANLDITFLDFHSSGVAASSDVPGMSVFGPLR